MEIYKEAVNPIEFEAPDANVAVTVDYTYNGGTVTPIIPTKSVTEPRIWTINSPYLPDEGKFTINWRFTLAGIQNVKTDTYDVVTPYVSTRWIKKNLLEDATDEQIRAAEASARFIINSHTGQDFGKRNDTYIVNGTRGGSLQLPSRLLSLTSLNGATDAPGFFSVSPDGWSLNFAQISIPPLKADYYGLHMEQNGVISNPNNVSLRAFRENYQYTIEGLWGWDSVPDAITEAAKLLINDYAGADAQYRDRYLTSMTAADWRIQFNNGAFQETGNVRADQLLSGYVMRRGWAVI